MLPLFRPARARRTTFIAAALALTGFLPAQAQEGEADRYREIESKYIFGFTEGSDIGLEGEKEISVQSVARAVKRAGTFRAFEHKLELEFTPTQFMQVEMGVIGATHYIRNVPDLDNRDRSGFAGMFGELRYLVVGRGPGSPIGLTLAVEPEIARLDDTSGARASRYETEFRLVADTELVPNRLFMAVNALYEPEWVHPKNEVRWERETTVGLSAALAYRITPEVVIGSEVGYLRKYDALAFGKIEGQAVYAGPTLYVQLTKKAFLQAAWSTQVTGRESIERRERAESVFEAIEAGEDPIAALPPHHHHRDLKHFERHRIKLKLAYEF